MGSTRLPGKSVLPLFGKPLVERIIERLHKVSECDEIILAIPNTKDNDILEEIANRQQIRVFKGSENNLLDRYYQAANVSHTDVVVRFPADNPVPEPRIIDQVIRHHRSQSSSGFCSNLASVFDSNFPDGIGAEVFDAHYLKELMDKQLETDKKEHLHLNFYDYKNKLAVDTNWCPVSAPSCEKEIARPDIVLDVNTKAQYDLMYRMYNDLYPINQFFTIEDIIRWWDKNIAV